MFGPLQAVPAALLLALATLILAPAPLAAQTRSNRSTTVIIIQGQSSGGSSTSSSSSSSSSSRRQMSVRRSSSSGKQTAKKPAYKFGEKVKVDWGNEVNDGEVIGFSGGGWIKVRIDHRGRETTLTLPPDHIWRVPQKKLSAADKKLRTWTSRSGKFTIKAKFVKLDEDDNLTLEKEDGKTLVVALDKLTDGDEKLARRLAGFDEDE